MANYATNIFHASTENKQDLNKIEAFLDDNFNGFVNQRQNLYPHTDIRVRGRIRELSDILAR